MYRALLTAIKPGRSQDIVIEYSLSLAERYHLEVDACSVIDQARLAPSEPVPLGAGAFKAERDERAMASARQHAAELKASIEAGAISRGVKCSAQVREGDTVNVLSNAVGRCDALVCGHTPGGDSTEQSMLHSILKHCPRPAIIVPHADFEVGKDVMVAYDGSAQAARALASFAESGLADGRPVRIVTFDAGTGTAKEHAEIAHAFLQRHGIASDMRVEKMTRDIGGQILAEVHRVPTSMLVMGAFGRSAVREFFFGSVSRCILNVLPVPVFLNH